MISTAAIVLAAGRASRADRDGGKALALLDGATFLERTCASLRAAGAMPILVVVAEPHAAAIERALPAGCVAVRNPAPERGMLGSLQVGLEHAVALGAERIVVSLIDHPRVRASTVRALLDVALEHGALVCRPRYAGRRGHPYVITGAAIDRLRAAPITARARDVLRTISPALDVDVDDPAVLEDLDRPLPDRARPSRALAHDADRSLSR